jgi:hypothetical protein
MDGHADEWPSCGVSGLRTAGGAVATSGGQPATNDVMRPRRDAPTSPPPRSADAAIPSVFRSGPRE